MKRLCSRDFFMEASRHESTTQLRARMRESERERRRERERCAQRKRRVGERERGCMEDWWIGETTHRKRAETE